MDLAVEIYKVSEQFPKNETYGIISQIRRCAISIPSNIAEGRQRGSKKDMTRFFLIAYGSAGELETQIELSKRLGFANDIDFSKSDSLLNEVQKILTVMIRNMK